ncbi:MAG: glycosyltransferase [Chloroflexi bacterium]|nr:glycosyltransferase [Chloroflexota bacterium]
MKGVTVLVAVKNKRDTIEACLRSILEVDYPVARVMVLDGYSTDGTFQVLQRFADKVEIHQLEANLSATFNWALDRVQTEYVALTDADCVVARDWLTELLRPFDEINGLAATAGYCGTPEGLSNLQTMIGLELENRFKRFPQYITRAPTMNLCVKTEAARKTRFDEKQIVAVETDFGYRLRSLGKIFYAPGARVWHYHRASWRAYFRQQRDQAKWAVRVACRHRGRALGDHISTRSMIAQIPLLLLAFAFLPLSLLEPRMLFVSSALFLTILGLYLNNIRQFASAGPGLLPFLGLFAFRNIAWALGVTEGSILLVWSYAKGSENRGKS